MSLDPFPLLCHPNTLSSCLNGNRLWINVIKPYHKHQSHSVHQNKSNICHQRHWKETTHVKWYDAAAGFYTAIDVFSVIDVQSKCAIKIVFVQKKSLISNQVRVVGERESYAIAMGAVQSPLAGKYLINLTRKELSFLFSASVVDIECCLNRLNYCKQWVFNIAKRTENGP